MMISLLDDGTSSTASLMVTVADENAADELTISLSSSLLERIDDAIIAGKTMRLPQSFTLRAKENSTGTGVVMVTVSDGETTAEQSIGLTVTENVAPAIELAAMATIETNTATTVSFIVMDANIDLGDTVSVTADETGVEADDEILTIEEVVADEGQDNSYSVNILSEVAGQTTLTVTATDSAMNSDTQSIRLTVNTTPKITLSDAEISLLDEGTPSEAEVMVMVTDAEAADEITIELTVDASAPVEIVGESVATIESNAARDPRAFRLRAIEDMTGTAIVTVSASDGKVTAEERITVTVDENTSPTISIAASIDNLQIQTQRQVDFTVIDANGDISTRSIVVEVEDRNIITVIGNVEEDDEREDGYRVSIMAGTMAENTTLTVTVTDTAGNKDTAKVRVTVVRERINEAPQIRLVQPEVLTLLDASPSPRNTGEVRVSVSDDVAGTVGITMEAQPANLLTITPPTTPTVTIRASESPVRSDAFSIAAEDVEVSTTVMVTITATDSERGEATTILAVMIEANVAPVIAMVAEQVVPVGDMNTVEFTVLDANGNIDPDSIMVEETAADTDLIDIIGVVESVQGEVDTYSIEIEGKTAGMTTMTISAMDDGDAEATPREVRVRVNAAPQIVEVSPDMISLLDDGTSSTASLMVTVADENAADELTISLSSSLLERIDDAIIAGKTMRLPQSFTLRAKANSTGTGVVMVTVSDGETTAEQSIGLTVTENVAPAIELAAMATIETNTATTVSFIVMDTNIVLGDTVSVTADETGVEADDEILTIEEVVADEGQDNSYSVKILSEVAGQTTLTVTATDSAMNSDTQSIRLTVNTTPEIELSDAEISLLDEGTPSEAVVMVTVADAEAADEITIELTVDASAPVEIVGVSTATIESNAVRDPRAFRLRAIEDMTGTAIVTVSASDGKVTAEERITVTVDENTSPTISIAASIDNLQIQTQRQVGFTVMDANGDISTRSIVVEVEDRNIITVIGNVEEDDEREDGYRVSIMAGTMERNTTLTVTVTDTAGNKDTAKVRVTVVRERINEAPQIRLVQPEALTLLDARPSPRNTGEVRVSVSDDVAGTVGITMEAQPANLLTITPPTTPTVTIRASESPVRSDAFSIAAEDVEVSTTVMVTITATDSERGEATTILAVMIEANVAPVIAMVAEQVVPVGDMNTVEFTVLDANGNIDPDSIMVEETAADTDLIDIIGVVESVQGEVDTYSIEIEGKTAGMTTMTISAMDDGDAEATPREVRVRVNAAPQIVEVSPDMISLLDDGTSSTASLMVTVADENAADELTISLSSSLLERIDDAIIAGKTMRLPQSFTLRAKANSTGTGVVMVTVSDGETTAEQSIGLTVTENVAPAIELAAMATIETNTATTVSFIVMDTNIVLGDTVSVTADETGVEADDEILTIEEVVADEGQDNSYSVKILSEVAGQTTLTVTATDSAMNSDTQSIRLTVNTTPEIELSDAEISLLDEGTPSEAEVMVTVADADAADEITIELTVDASAPVEIVGVSTATIESNAVRDPRAFRLRAIEGTTGTAIVTVSASDGKVTAEERITVTVDENTSPTISIAASIDNLQIQTQRQVGFTVMDANGDISTRSIVVEVEDRNIITVIGNVEEDDEREDGYRVSIMAGTMERNTTLTVTVTDTAGNKDTAKVRVTVVRERINEAPQIRLVQPEALTLLDARPSPRNTGEVRVSVSDDVAGTVGITMEAQPANLLTITPPTTPTVTIRASESPVRSDAFSIAAEDVEVSTTVMVTITATDSERGEATTILAVMIEANVAPVIAMVAEQVVPVGDMNTVEFTVLDANGNIDPDSIMVEETAADTDLIDIIGVVESVQGEVDTYSIEIEGKTAGMTTMTIIAMDDGDAAATPREVRVRVNAAPQIVEVSPDMISLLDDGTSSTASLMVTVADENAADELTISLSSSLLERIDDAIIAGKTMRLPQSFTLRAKANSTGTGVVMVTVSDGETTAEQRIGLTVTENVAPAIELAAMATIETNTATTVSFIVMDANIDLGDTVSVTADETGVEADDEILIIVEVVADEGQDNSYSVNILSEVAGQTTLTVTATDSAMNSDTQSIRLTVNTTPKITLSDAEISLLDEGTPSEAEVMVMVTDAEGCR